VNHLFALSLLPLLLATGCVQNRVDRFTVDRVMARGSEVPDVDKACQLGSAFAHALAAPPRASRPPRRAMVIAEMTAGLCAEAQAWEAELDAERALRNLVGDARLAEVKDARLREERARQQAAARLYRSFQHLDALWGPIGDGCARVPERDQLVLLLGLYAGVNALLHDKASGGRVGVPADVIGKVARGARCLSDATWWHVPSALEAACWATVPGSAPEGVDPWVALEQAARAGEASGVRLALGLEVLFAYNAGQEELAIRALKTHAASLQDRPQLESGALLDEYARLVSLHVSDLLWTSAKGYRAPGLGPPIPEETLAPASEDPFADPFAEEIPL
jgi:hypothetical protein